MVSVKFTTGWSLYNAGDVAGFEPATARKLVEERKIAEYVDAVVNEEENNDDDGNALTLSKFARLNLEQLLDIAKEKGIDLGEATLKKDVQPIVKKALFGEEGD